MRKKMILIAPLAILGIVIFTWIGGEVVMILWNWLLPALFGWPQITFWQALGLLALCRILFGGLRLGGHGSPHSRIGQRIRQRIDEHWEQMTPEEREKARHGLHGCWDRETPLDSKPNA